MSTREHSRTPWRGTVRVLAAMFLLLACTDLAFPQLCGEDNEPFLSIQTAPATSTHADASGEPQPHRAPADDCFCCCSHILSAESISPLTKLAIVSDAGRMPHLAVPIVPVKHLFHPPRLA